MTEHSLQILADLQGTILGILENYLKLYDTILYLSIRQAQQLHDLQREIQKVHNLLVIWCSSFT